MSEEKDGVSPEETEIVEGEEEEVEDEFQPFDEIHDNFVPSRVTKVMGADGLPTQDAEVLDSGIPPLSVDTLICMGDFSSFVQRDVSGNITKQVTPQQVTQSLNGMYWHEGEFFEPIRPPCRHYVRQLGQGSDNPDMKIVYRLCSARRTTEGAFMSVRDTGMWACSMREPRDLESERRHLDVFDENKIREGSIRVGNSIFKGSDS